ncbi:hypothetical protein MTO96_032816 [Rhipicephalus appendiculatus]
MPCTFNNLVSFFYGDLFTHDHPTRTKLHRLMQQVGLALFSDAGHQFLPRSLRRLLAWIPFTRDHRVAQVLGELNAFSKEQIELYKAAKPGGEANDFIHGYIKKIEESTQQPNPLFTDGYLVGNVNSFLMAGTFSATMAMTWHMINFAKNSDTVQARVQREIDEVVGQERMPTWEDRKQMPYTLACVWEVERWKTGAPLGVARE